MPNFILHVRPRDLAFPLLDWFVDRGYEAYDTEIAPLGMVLILNVSRRTVTERLREARDEGIIVEPYTIRVVKIGEGRVALRSIQRKSEWPRDIAWGEED